MHPECDIDKRIYDANLKFDQSHLVYLQTDDSPLKLELRRKLEECIEDYLCLVPNDRKFIFEETAYILYQSVANFKQFSVYKACTGWKAISLYASNLLSQPWRKEYKSIKTYSGYYKHEIEANLMGAMDMFRLMGYNYDKVNGVLVMNGPVDPDKVSHVSKDAIVAFVECKILKRIWEDLSENFDVTWEEILEFRKDYTGTPQQAIRALTQHHLEIVNSLSRLEPCYKFQKMRNCRDNEYITDVRIDSLKKCNIRDGSSDLQSSGHPYYLYGPCNRAVSLVNMNDKCNKIQVMSAMKSANCKPHEHNFPVNLPVSKSQDFAKIVGGVQNNDTPAAEKRYNSDNNYLLENNSKMWNDIPYIENINYYNPKVSEAHAKVVKSRNVKYTEPEDLDKWNCHSCTFLNAQNYNICQMCHKSRKQNVDESQIVEGKECPDCTLINDKYATTCDACTFRLGSIPN